MARPWLTWYTSSLARSGRSRLLRVAWRPCSRASRPGGREWPGPRNVQMVSAHRAWHSSTLDQQAIGLAQVAGILISSRPDGAELPEFVDRGCSLKLCPEVRELCEGEHPVDRTLGP